MQDALYLTLPGAVTARATPLEGETVAELLARTGWPTTVLPTICVLNGAPLLRAHWPVRALGAGDQLRMVARPMGGSGRAQGKQIMGLVAMIGLSVLAPGVGTLLGSFAQAAFLAGGAFVVSTLVRMSSSSKAAASDDDNVYSFSQTKNSAQLLQTIPVSYGRIKTTPPYAAMPWAEYSGNDQYLNVLLCQGSGKYQTESIYVDDTLLWSATGGVAGDFDGVQVEICPPGIPVTLFSINVATSSEVSGQELTTDWAGGFVAAPAATTTTALAIDVAAANGLGYVNAQGNTQDYVVQLYVEARTVDDLGLPTGAWVQILNTFVKGATKKPKRWSFRIDVSPGRYQVRMRRGSSPYDDDSGTMDSIVWMGLRSFLTGNDTFAHEQVIALRMRATQQLTDSSASNISVVQTRILPMHNGTQWVEAPTRSPAWAAWDIATNTAYGARRQASKVDVQRLYELAALATARGDCFDYTFDSAVSVPEALDTTLAACRAKHRWAGDVLTLVRDEWRPVPSMLITDRETVRGTFSADYEMLPSDSVDAVICEYVDQDTWRAEEVQYPPDYAATNPKRVQLKGIIQRAHAYREAGFYYRQHIYRRVSVSLDMEHDGRLVSLGDQVAVQSDMPGAWGTAGTVLARDGVTLTLEPAPAWDASGAHYVLLRSRTGGAFGPVRCGRGASDALCVLDAQDLAQVEASQGRTLAEVLARREGAELPTYAHGAGTAWQRRCIALTGTPSGDKVSLTFAVDDIRVHDDDGTPDLLPALPALGGETPVIAGLIANLAQNVLEPVLTASWWAAAGAVYYRARISYDEGATWEPLPDTTVPQLSAVVQPAALWLQVQGVGARRGAWAQVELEAPVIRLDPALFDLDGMRKRIVGRMEAEVAAYREISESMALALAAADAGSALATAELDRAMTIRTDALTYEVAGAKAEVARVERVFADETEAIAQQIESVTADLGANTAAVTEVKASLATAQQSVATLGTRLDAEVQRTDANTGAIATNAANISNTWAAVVDTNSSLTSNVNALNARIDTANGAIGTVAASVKVTAIASASVPSGAIAAYEIAVKVGDSAATAQGGLLIAVYGSPGAYTSKIFLRADTTSIMDSTGGKALFVVDGSGQAYFNVAMLNVTALSAISANIGWITAGTIVSANGKMIIDLNNNYMLCAD